jgi:rubrerythrin
MTSLKASSDILAAMIGLRDAEALRSNTAKLLAETVKANSFAIAAQAAESALADRVRELEAQVREFEDWKAEKERYELVPLHDGALAYAIKPSMQGVEPAHYICPSCYQKRVKSILQGVTYHLGGHQLKCPVCKLEVQHSWPSK